MRFAAREVWGLKGEGEDRTQSRIVHLREMEPPKHDALSVDGKKGRKNKKKTW